MTTIALAEIPIRDDRLAPIVSQSWLEITTVNDRGGRFEWPHGADRSIHIYGTAGSGFVLIMQGSNKLAPADDDADWFPLLDTEGNAISFTSVPAGDNLGTLARWIRPLLSSGEAGVTDLDLTLIARKGYRP